MEIKQKSAWDKLSMQEKAQLIKLSVGNGVSSLKQIRDTYNLYSSGGNLTHKYDGNTEETSYIETTSTPTKEQYITQQLDSIRNDALERSRNKTQDETTEVNEAKVYGSKYLINKLQKEYDRALKSYNKMIEKAYAIYKENNPIRSHRETDIEYIENYYKYSKDRLEWLNSAKQILNDAKSGKYNGKELANCIANLSEFYPHGLPYGNRTFENNAKKYGFSLINTLDVQPGDLVQPNVDPYGNNTPYHIMIYNGIDKKGKHSFNYSDGYRPWFLDGELKGGYGVGKHYPDVISEDDKHLWGVNVYRYTGTHQDSIQWSNEWEQQYGTQKAFGGPLVHKKSGKDQGESQNLNYPNLLPEVEVYPNMLPEVEVKPSVLYRLTHFQDNYNPGQYTDILPYLPKQIQGPVRKTTDYIGRLLKATGNIMPQTGWFFDLADGIVQQSNQNTTPILSNAGNAYVGLGKLTNQPILKGVGKVIGLPDLIDDSVEFYNALLNRPKEKKVSDWVQQQAVDAIEKRINTKSTGGPLYPFSFEKNPFLKTPIVRY